MSDPLVIDYTSPVLTEPAADKAIIRNGQILTLSVKGEVGLRVWVDVLALDTTQSESITLADTEPGTYSASIAINEDNTADDGLKPITITATDAAGNTAVASVSVELLNFADLYLTVPAGIGLIHIPLKVTAVAGQPMEIQTVGDLYDALGGADNVNFIITRDSSAGVWRSYLGDRNKGTSADQTITDDMGILTVMKQPVSLHVEGDALGTDGVSQIHLNWGINLIGVPLIDKRLQRVSDLMTLEGFEGRIASIVVSDVNVVSGKTEFMVVAQAGDPGDIAITGDISFIVTATEDGTAEIAGNAWSKVSASSSAAPPMTVVGHQVDGGTPVLAVHGAVVDEITGGAKDGFRVFVKNLSTGASFSTLSGRYNLEGEYSVTFIDLISSRVARVGDVLEITVETPSPFLRVRPLRHIVSTDDVKVSRIRLPDIVAYRIPQETKLHQNYPNPFNPETWIPYDLASEASVEITIYNAQGHLIRKLTLGHQPAGSYLTQEKAAYWNGRNERGETVSSGLYFYHLRTGDYSAVRQMVILK